MKLKSLHLAAALALAVALAGCGVQSTDTTSTDNPEVKVERLFRFEHCTIYRFTDYGDAVHYADCSGHATTSERDSYQCGKHRCTREVIVAGDAGSDE